MHIHSGLSIQGDDNTVQAADMLRVIDSDLNRYLVASEEASFQYVNGSRDGFPFQS